jgi:Ni/Co efflux regulator RcnB
MRRTVLTLAAVLAAAAPLAAQQHAHGHDHGQPGLPAGWHARLDRANASMDNVKFTAMGDGFHATLGPAAVFWNPENTVSGAYRAEATFTQTRAPTHPEAYGLFIAGRDLEGAAADYMYFLVRGDGKYLIKHRAANGDIHTITDWTEHAAVAKQDAAGKATNALAVEAGDFGVRLFVNGTRVAEFLKANVPYLQTDGVVGLRINHNLDVHVAGFRVVKQ